MFDTDRNLLFAILAVQLRGIPPQKIMELAAAWALDPSRDLPDRMQEADLLTEAECLQIQDLVRDAIRAHNGDMQGTLASFGDAQLLDRTKLTSFFTEPKRSDSVIPQDKFRQDPPIVQLGNLGVDETPGRYTGASEYARGGMGRVLLVHDEHIGRDVALKELLPLSSDSSNAPTPVQLSMSLLARFVQEAQITGQLEHPSIVPVYELGRRRDGALYYTMKLVRGKTLADVVRECTALEERLNLLPHFVDLCQAIAYAHSRGVIHRDIKPSNVMIGEFGETVVLDWGLSKSRGDHDVRRDALEETLRQLHLEGILEVEQTKEGNVLGTPSYMPPEQARGELDLVDARSDVYSLGAVLYELLTGSRPFTGTRPIDVLNKVICDDPKSIRVLEPEAPPELVAICEKSMAKDRDRRYLTAGKLAEEMQRFMSGALVSAYRYSPAEHVRRLVSRHKVLFSSAAVFAVVLAAVSVVYMWNLAQKNIQLAASREEEHAQRLKAEAAHVAANDARWLAEQQTYVSQIRLISEYANGHNYGAARQLIWETNPTLRNWEWGYLVNRCNQAQLTLERCAMVRLSPDGKQLATLSLSEPPRVWSASTGDLLTTLETEPVRYLSLVYSPAGDTLLAGATDGSVRSWDPKTGKSLTIFTGHHGHVTDAAFSPDGQSIVSVSSDGTLNRWDVATGQLIASARTEGESLNSVMVAGNGAHILTGLEHGNYAVWDAVNLYRMWSFDGVTPSFDSKGGAILVARESGAMLLDSATGDPQEVTFHHGATVLRTRFDAQANLVLTLGADGEIKIWNATNAIPVTQLTPPDETIDVVFSPSGTRLLSYNSKGGGQLWDAKTGKLLATFDGHSAPVTMSLFTTDERTFVTASRDQTVKVWSIAGPIGRRVLFDSGEALESLSVAPGSGRAALASESGRCVVLDVRRGASVADFGAFGMQFSPSISLNSTGGQAAIVVDDFTPMVYDITENRVVTPYYGHRGIVRSVSMSPNDQLVVSCGADGTAQVWDAENGETSAVLTGHKDTVHSAVFDAQGDRILTASGDGTARLWDRKTGAELTTYRGHTNDVIFAQFSPDGRRVISVSTDRTTRIWDAESGQELLVFDGNNRGFSCALFSPDGSRAFTGGVDGDVKVWDTESGELLDSCEGHRGLVQTLQIGLADNQVFSASADGFALMWEAASLFGQEKRDRTGAQMLDDLAQYKTRADRSQQPPLFHEDAEDFHVLLSADAWHDNLTRLAVILRSGDPDNRTDDSGEEFSIPGGPVGNAFRLLGLVPGDRISSVTGTGTDETSGLTAALDDLVAESPTGVTLQIVRGQSRRLHLIPMEVHQETVAVTLDWAAGRKLLENLRDELVASRTMLDDVRRQNALERGEIQSPSEPILGVWLIAKPSSDPPVDSPDLGLAAWDRIVAVDGQEIRRVEDLVAQLERVINSESTDRPRSLAMEVVRGEFRRTSIQLNFNL